MVPAQSEKVRLKMEEKKKQILNCAVELFAQKGYVNTPVRDIIDASGYGTSTFYRYFTDKEDLLKSLLADFLDQIISEVKDYFNREQDAYTRFVESKRLVMEIFAANPRLSEIYVRVGGISPAVDQCLKDFDDRYLWFVEQNIRFGVTKGYFKDMDIKPICHSILAIIKYALYKWLVLKDLTREEMIEMVVSFLQSLGEGLYHRKKTE